MERGPVEGIAGVPTTHVGAWAWETIDANKLNEIRRKNFFALMNKAFFITKGIDVPMSGLFRLPIIIQHRKAGSGAESFSLMGKSVFYRHPVARLDINGWVTGLLLQSGAFPRTSED
jgi:hypothetical protein